MASTTRSPSIPILTDIYYLFIDDKAAFDYLIHNNVLKIPLNCPECSSGMSPKSDKYYMYRCKRKNCRNLTTNNNALHGRLGRGQTD